jgi:SET domain-containing protein
MPVRNGRGLVARKALRRGAIVVEITGKIVTGEEVWRYWEIDPKLGANCFRYDADHYIDPDGTVGQYANHSCNPNSGGFRVGRRLLIKAIRPIAGGEEVTHDYSTFLGADDVWTMRCNCGEGNCRKTVKNVAKLPLATLRRYRRLGIIPDFIMATRRARG